MQCCVRNFRLCRLRSTSPLICFMHSSHGDSVGVLGKVSTPGNDLAGPVKRYEHMVSQGILQNDPHQHKVAIILEELLNSMKLHQKKMEAYHAEFQTWENKRNELREKLIREEEELEAKKKEELSKDWKELAARWFTRKGTKREAEAGAGKMVARIKREKKLDTLVGQKPLPPESPSGVYLYGNVGSGKTLLMDLLFSSSEGVVQHRRRMHFHAAMLELHDRMHKVGKQRKEHGEEQSVTPIFDEVARGFLQEIGDDFQGASLLCFDEVQVVDPFTAVALAGVLGRLLKKGLILVATSNRPFNDLYKDGLQKELFTRFVDQLGQHCRPVPVGNEIDYRRVLAEAYSREHQTNYFWPLDDQSESRLESRWRSLVGDAIVSSNYIPVMFGRYLEVPECNGVARFTFEQLCSKPIGSADYIALARNYHTVFMTGIPVMSMKIRDKARRFITLVDELYNHNCHFICTAAASPDELFMGTEEGALLNLEDLQFEGDVEGSKMRRNVLASGSVAPLTHGTSYQLLLSGYEEAFAFQRATSRLIEMQTPSYLRKPNHIKL